MAGIGHRESGEAMRASETNSACAPLCLWLLREATATATWQKYLFICLPVFLRLSAGMCLASTPSRPRLQLCVLVYHDCDSGCLCVALALALTSWSWSWSCLLAPPFADTTCLILVLETLCWLLFLPNCAPAPFPYPFATRHCAVGRGSRSSLTSLSLGACVSFIYDYLCTTCFVFIACRCR